MRIALDAMGSDRAPAVEVAGAIDAAGFFGFQGEIVLVGDRAQLEKELSRHRRVPSNISIHHASEAVSMEDKPVESFRHKKDSSLIRMMELLKTGKVEAVISAGNTGAVVACAKLMIGTLSGIDRPAIATVIPASRGVSILLDAGANSDCKPHHLFQFAVMGREYSRFIAKKPDPLVSLLSIGTESTKGNELTRETYKLLEKSPLNFIGNIEGRDVFMGRADVIVADGFVGNVVIKVAEGLVAAIHRMLVGEIKRHLLRTIGGFLMKPAFIRIWRRGDYSEYGGAPLLGIDGICIICHGSSPPKAIKNAIRVAEQFQAEEVNQKIVEAIAQLKVS